MKRNRTGTVCRELEVTPPGDVVCAGALVILAAVVFAYSNSFGGPFIFDDLADIVNNPYIRSLWPPWNACRAPLGEAGTTGRPLINLSFAMNYAISGVKVWSYHALNVAIHIMAALVLFGIVRRTLLLGKLRKQYARVSAGLALACACIWAVHPLQTQAVTYIIQRCESLMGLLFLLTLYCAIRGWQSPTRQWWHLAAILACLLGVGVKEVIVMAPVVVLIFDWVFVHGSIIQVLRQSCLLYIGLLLCLVALAALVAAGGTVTAIGKVPFTAMEYALTQPEVILHYLRLTIWPSPLCLDYAWKIATLQQALPYVIIILTLLIVSAWALWHRYPLGFLGAWFFLILAPTSSVIPLRNIAFEQRMYLPLAAVAMLGVIGGYEAGSRLMARLVGSEAPGRQLGRTIVVSVSVALVVMLGLLTFQRNYDYRDAVSIWNDTVQKCPQNLHARINLSYSLFKADRPQDAIPHCREVLRIEPHDAYAHKNLALVLCRLGRTEEALMHLREVLHLEPRSSKAQNDMGTALLQLGRTEEALAHFKEAFRLDPRRAHAHNNLALALCRLGRTEEALMHFREALHLEPRSSEAQNNMGTALLQLGRTEEALMYFREALHLDPHSSEAHNNLGLALTELNGAGAAIPHLRKALDLKPAYIEARINLAIVLVRVGNHQEAMAHCREVLRLRPEHVEARELLERLKKQEVEQAPALLTPDLSGNAL